jgi:hypothetical protein
MTAAELRAMYHRPYTVEEIVRHASQVCATSQQICGYFPNRITPEVRAELEKRGFTLRPDGVISWAEKENYEQAE